MPLIPLPNQFPPSIYNLLHSNNHGSLHKRPKDEYNNVTKLKSLTKSSAPGTIHPTNLINYSVNATGNSGNTGSPTSGFDDCEKNANRTTNSNNHQQPKHTVQPNVIVEYRSENSDSQSTLSVPNNNLRKISKAIIRTSHQQFNSNLKDNNYNTSHLQYTAHIRGNKNKNNKNSSQRKIGEE